MERSKERHQGKSGIYKLTNIVNGKVYIGQTVDLYGMFSRYINKQTSSVSALRRPIIRAIIKYGHEMFTNEVLEVCLINELDSREAYWIKEYNCTDATIGYNILKARLGNANRGLKYSSEHVEKIKKGQQRFQESPEGQIYRKSVAARISLYFSNEQNRKQHSQACKERGVINNLLIDGHPWNKGVKGSMKACMKHMRKAFTLIKDDKEYKMEGIHDAAKELGCLPSSISQLVNGTTKSCRGYRLKQL